MTAPTDHRQRSAAEIDHDLIAACARLGELAMAAQIGMRPPDRNAIGSTAEGLRRLLVEGAQK